MHYNKQCRQPEPATARHDNRIRLVILLGTVKIVPQVFQVYRGCRNLQSRSTACVWLCSSKKSLSTYWIDLGPRKGICMVRSSVCRVMQGTCPFRWPQQLGVFLGQVLAKLLWKAMQLCAEHVS